MIAVAATLVLTPAAGVTMTLADAPPDMAAFNERMEGRMAVTVWCP